MLARTALVGLITITLATYLITYSHVLYERLAPGLSWLGRENPFREAAIETTSRNAHNAEELRRAGRDVVLLPFLDAAKEAVVRVSAFRRAEPTPKFTIATVNPEKEQPS